MWELRDAYEDLAPLYARAWLYESRDGHLPSNLERYHLAAQTAIERADAFYRVTQEYTHTNSLPPFDEVVSTLTALFILLVFALFAVADVSALDAGARRGSGDGDLLMSLVAGVPVAKLGEIVTGGAVQLAPVYVAVIFGALLGRVTIETGIARTIVDLAAEYGGEQPMLLSLGFCAIVALLFTSLSGLGGIIMVGSIVLPIMMTAGVPRDDRRDALPDGLRARLHLQHRQLDVLHEVFRRLTRATDPRTRSCWQSIDAVALLLYAAISFRRERAYATWAVRAQPEENRACRRSRCSRRSCRSCCTTRLKMRSRAGVLGRGALRRRS